MKNNFLLFHKPFGMREIIMSGNERAKLPIKNNFLTYFVPEEFVRCKQHCVVFSDKENKKGAFCGSSPPLLNANSLAWRAYR